MKPNDPLSKFLKFEDNLARYDGYLDNILTGLKKKIVSNLIDDTTRIGIEVEVERVFRNSGILPIVPDVSLWRNVEDGSLRNDGREFVSLPIKGDQIVLALDILNETLTKEKTCIGHEFTDRTSVHIHVNIRDLTAEQLMTFIISYVLVEPLLYEVSGRERGKGVFCVPITESSLQNLLGATFSRFEQGSDKFLYSLQSWQKYTGFNLAPIFNYGTIEFRHLYGTKDATTIIKWINLIFSIKRFAMSQSYTKLKQRVLDINTTSEYRYLIQEIFGQLSKEVECTLLDKMLEDTSILLKNMFTYSSDRVQELISSYKYEILKLTTKLPFIQLCIKQGYLKSYTIEDRIAESIERIKKWEKRASSLSKEVTKYEAHLATINPKTHGGDHSLYSIHISNLRGEVETLTSSIDKENLLISKLKLGEIPKEEIKIGGKQYFTSSLTDTVTTNRWDLPSGNTHPIFEETPILLEDILQEELDDF